MDYDDAYANAAHIPGAEGYPPRWEAAAAKFRAGASARLDLPYGPHPRQRFDLFLPAGAPMGLVMFVHGGYWLKFGREIWSHLAAGPVARGWAVAMPSYRLAPEVAISEITSDIRGALLAAADEVAGPIVLAGHSAGGHLVARMLCADVALPEEIALRLARVVPISPVADLRPLMHTKMNDDLRLTPAAADAESPALHRDVRAVPVSVWVGAHERPAFLDQAAWLAEAWPRAELRVAAERHHFDVVEGLETPDSPLTRALLDGI
ncbi:MAG: alpha/beta hydrolase [Paracoccaceae bacterium]